MFGKIPCTHQLDNCGDGDEVVFDFIPCKSIQKYGDITGPHIYIESLFVLRAKVMRRALRVYVYFLKIRQTLVANGNIF